MDETGSSTFALFDKIVSQFIGQTVNDLINIYTIAHRICSFS